MDKSESAKARMGMAVDQTRLKWNGWGWVAHKDALVENEAAWTTLAAALNMPSLLATPPRALEDIPLEAPRLTAADRDAFTRILGEDRIREDKLERARHAAGRCYGDLLRLRGGDLSAAPDVVVYPRGADEVLSILRHAAETGLGVLIFGGGTGPRRSDVRGNFRALLAIDLSGMDRMLEIDKATRTIRVEAGITGQSLERTLGANALTMGHHTACAEFSTLGGWIAGDSRTEKSRPSDWFLSAKIATPRGFVQADNKGLREMIVGSEGLFGVIVEALVQAKPVADERRSNIYLFRNMTSGVGAILSADTLIRDAKLSSTAKTKTEANWPEPPRGIAAKLRKVWLESRGYNGQSVRAHVETDNARDEKKLAKLMRRAGGIGYSVPPVAQFSSPYFRDALLDRGLGVATWEVKSDWQKAGVFCESVAKGLQTALSEKSPRPGAKALVMYEISGEPGEAVTAHFTCIFPRALDDETAQWHEIGEAARRIIEAHGGRIETGNGAKSKFDGLDMLARQTMLAVKTALDPNGVLNPGIL